LQVSDCKKEKIKRLHGQQPIAKQSTGLNIVQWICQHVVQVGCAEAFFFCQGGEDAAPRDEGAGEGAVVDLLCSAGGAPGLEDDELRLFLFRQLKGLFRAFAEGCVHAFPVSVRDSAVHDFRRGPGGREAAQHLRTDRDNRMAGKEGQERFASVVPAVILAVFAQEAGADHDLHAYL